jgi:hypothetical protein
MQVCIEVDDPPSRGERLVFRCPVDASTHPFALASLRIVSECPPGLEVTRLEDYEPASPLARRPWWRFWEWGRG